MMTLKHSRQEYMEYSRLYEREDLMDGDVGAARLCRSGQSPEIAVAVLRLFDLARNKPCNKEMAEVAVVELLVEQTEARSPQGLT